MRHRVTRGALPPTARGLVPLARDGYAVDVRTSVWPFLFASAALSCGAAAPPDDASSLRERALAAYESIRIVRVSEVAAPASPAAAKQPVIFGSVRNEVHEIDVDFVNQTGLDQSVLATDGTPVLSLQVYLPAEARWGELWSAEGIRCDNALHLIDVPPGRTLRITLGIGSGTTKVKARVQLRGRTADEDNRLVTLTSAELDLSIEPELLELFAPVRS